MVGRRRTRNVNQLHEELDPRDIEIELHPENEDSDKEYNLFHVSRSSESSDEETQYQNNNHRNNLERVFDYQEVRDALKVKIVAIKLKKHASVWWEQLKLERAHENKPRIRTWEKMKQELRKKFLSDCDVYKLATKVEKQLKEKEGRKSTYSVSRGPSQGYVTNRASGSQSTKSMVTKASQTSQTHDVRAGSSRTKPKSVQCFKCKGFWHISFDCPNQRVFTFVEEDIEEEYDIPLTFDEPQEDQHEDIIYGDKGELLVIQRALSVDLNRDEAWLRNIIFHM
ncbi:RNA-directed DNA polymerase [Tanacetum coccineum]